MKKIITLFTIFMALNSFTVVTYSQNITFIKDVRITYDLNSPTDIENQEIINYTQEDFQNLCRIIEAEAGIETIQGKIAVGNVIINRVLDERFPNSITEVVFAKNQFSPVSNGSIYNIPSEDSIKAAKLVLEGETTPESKNAVFFWADYVNKNNWIWTREITGKIGTHYFGK